MRWQYGAAVALNYVCVLHGGDESVAWIVVDARYLLYYHGLVMIGMWGITYGGYVVAGAQ